MKLLPFFLFTVLFLSTSSMLGQKIDDRFAVVSPDSKKIAFASNRAGSSHIFIVNIDGTDMYQLTYEGGHSGPNWSGDAESLTYSRIRDQQFFDVYQHRLGTSQGIKLVNDSSLNFASTWRDNLIYYSSNRDHQDQLRTINVRTGEDNLVVDQIEHHNGISFSPDNSLAILVVKNEGNNWNLALFNSQQKEITREFQHAAREDYPNWSPTDNHIVFSSNREGTWNIYSMRKDGSEVTNLTNGKGNSRFASWFPDGQRLIFSSDRVGNGYRIFTMNRDGSNQKELVIKTK